MARRIHLSQNLISGLIQLDDKQAHHLRDVLRAEQGDEIELFDDAGHIAAGVIEECDKERVTVRVREVLEAPQVRQVVIASAVPKGNRADWMVEKLSELGVSRFIPLESERSVVLPAGKGKYERWRRIAEESAKQSRRAGVMQIDELTALQQVLQGQRAEGRGQKEEKEGEVSSCGAIYLSTEAGGGTLISLLSSHCPRPSALTLLVGPEGGWTPGEIARMKSANLTAAKLTGTILRVETAAVVAAAIAMIERT